MPQKKPAQRKPAGVKKPAKSGKPAMKKPAGSGSRSPDSDSMGTTLVLGGVSPINESDVVGALDPLVGEIGPLPVFPLPGEEIPTSLPGPLPHCDLDEDREPSRFAQTYAPVGCLMDWDLMSREQQLYVWAHHESLELYPVVPAGSGGFGLKHTNANAICS